MITSVRNPKVVAAAKLRKRAQRDRERRFLVEGAQAVGEAVDSLETLFFTGANAVVETAMAAGVALIEVSVEVMERLTSTVTPQGLVGVAPFLDVPLDGLSEELGCVAVLCAGRDPGNAGTVLRSADAAGADAVVFTSESVDVYNPKTVRASAGSLFHLPVVRGVAAAEAVGSLRERGLTVYAATADGDRDLHDLDLTVPSAFLFGNEAWGLPGEVWSLADTTVRVPISGRAESLNLAAAATLCLFESAWQRRGGRGTTLGDLIAAAAHDIRSPVTATRNFAGVLLSTGSGLDDEQREMMLRAIIHDSEWMDHILRQLVDAARIVGGRLELLPEHVEVGEIVRERAAFHRADPQHPNVVWKGGNVRSTADPVRLRDSIDALIEAEVWWALEGDIEVSAQHREGILRVEVFRRGTDLTPDTAESIFSARRPGTGYGSKFGLFVARGVAETQGGTATAEVDNGLRLVLTIPAGGQTP